MKNEDKIACWYLVAFIDVLGQQHILRELRGLPDQTDQKQLDNFYNQLIRTAGIVDYFRNLFYQFFESSNRIYADLSLLSQTEREWFFECRKKHVKDSMFSDFIAFFMTLHQDTNKCPMRGIYCILGAIGSAFLHMAAKGYFIRGGIDIGVGIELDNGDIYGAALARAYALESMKAQYPRIIFGDEIMSYVNLQKNLPESNNPFDNLNMQIANRCNRLISTDEDGFPFLDYLGNGFKEDLIINLDYSIIIKKAYENIVNEWKKWRSEKNSKLAFRYMLLRDYFENRLPIWNILI